MLSERSQISCGHDSIYIKIQEMQTNGSDRRSLGRSKGRHCEGTKGKFESEEFTRYFDCI